MADGNENLPSDYDSKLKDSEEASQSNVNFYISAELSNNPVYSTAWEFTVGDGEIYGVYKNTVLQQGEVYIVFQRALTDDQIEKVSLAELKVQSNTDCQFDNIIVGFNTCKGIYT